MSELMLAGFVIAFGFVTAAIVASLTFWTAGDQGKLSLSFTSIGGAITSILFFMVSGPYLVISNGVALWRSGHLNVGVIGFCCIAAVFWSFCLGVLIIQLLFVSQVIRA